MLFSKKFTEEEFVAGGESVADDNCQILQTRVNRFKTNKEDVVTAQLKGYSCDIKFTGSTPLQDGLWFHSFILKLLALVVYGLIFVFPNSLKLGNFFLKGMIWMSLLLMRQEWYATKCGIGNVNFLLMLRCLLWRHTW